MKRIKSLIKFIPGTVAIYHLLRYAQKWVQVTNDFWRFRKLARVQRPSLTVAWTDRQYYLKDATIQTDFCRSYLYHTAWAARQLGKYKPSQHIDVSSSLNFVALVSAFVPIRHLDYRPPLLFLDNLECDTGDLMSLPFSDNSVDSLSCMHVIEHVGLGRYGDPIDPLGDIKAAKELARVLSVGGRLYFAAPVGKMMVCFNGHRIYNFDSVCALFPTLELEEWALIPDFPPDGLIHNAPPEIFNSQRHDACGCFLFRKLK